MNELETEPFYKRRPKVPIWRRASALVVDVLPVWLLSLLLGKNLILILVIWIGLRVVLVSYNQGQSLGRWAFDMKVIDERRGRSPGIVELAKREGLTGLGVSLAIIGITSLSPIAAQYLLLVVPLVADCGIAYFDELKQQAFHDRLAGTVVVPTRRGYSLDLKIKRWVAQLRRFVKQ